LTEFLVDLGVVGTIIWIIIGVFFLYLVISTIYFTIASLSTQNGNGHQKVVLAGEVRSMVENGWEHIVQLPDGSVVMRAQ
jgi:anionic cell wall polymer biosynthesis LytR-Cps2A-Psr (LCP) family protein